MQLNIQIYSFISSFLFGCLFYILLDLFYKFVEKMKIILKIIISFIFIMLMASLYFVLMLFINNGVIHIYFLFMILVGYIFVNFISLRLFTHLRKK